MSTDVTLTDEQEQQIVDAINLAEQKTSGEIRVHIEPHCKTEPLKRARRVFHELGMDETIQQNGVLIYVASEDHKVAVFAGKGIHEQVEPGFWDDVLAIIIEHFKKEEFEEGIEEAIHKAGDKLIELFPSHSADTDELTNEISYHDNREQH